MIKIRTDEEHRYRLLRSASVIRSDYMITSKETWRMCLRDGMQISGRGRYVGRREELLCLAVERERGFIVFFYYSTFTIQAVVWPHQRVGLSLSSVHLYKGSHARLVS